MTKKSTLTSVKLQNLILDNNNPRFAELYSGSKKEDDIIQYLLYSEAATDVAKAIFDIQEYYPDRPLWVLKDGDNYIVKDGNRRCAAVKALQSPSNYGLSYKKLHFDKLPVLIYHNIKDLENRIRLEHTGNLFKQWGRIAKALEAYRLFKSGSSFDSIKEYDSRPTELIKLASFYYAAVKIGGEDLKKLLRSGKGKTGGKTIIFERLFKFRNNCGYTFKNKSTHKIDIKNSDLFNAYIKAMVDFLKDKPDTKHQDIDSLGKKFLNKLKPFGFPPEVDEVEELFDKAETTDTDTESENSVNPADNDQSQNNLDDNSEIKNGKKKSIKHKPVYQRKRIPSSLEKLINECYNLDQNNFANSKTALTRVVFECTLKYVVENTYHNLNKPLSNTQQLRNAYYNKKGDELKFTEFGILKNKFTELIKKTGIRKAFEAFDLQNSHQIIHNYLVGATPSDAKTLCDNLIPLLEFMLQEEGDLLTSLDLTKL